MSRWQCPTCNGTYDDPQQNSMFYFHVCPPLAEWEFNALPPGQQLQAIKNTPGAPPWEVGDPMPISVGIRRIGHRDENILPGWQPPPSQGGDPFPHSQVPRVQNDPPRILVTP